MLEARRTVSPAAVGTSAADACMLAENRHVELYVEDVDYKQEIPQEVFSTLALMKSHLEKQ